MRITSSPRPRRGGGRAGATLVELMIAALLLAVIALAAGAFVYRSRADVAIQRGRRLAIHAANARMEALKSTPYTAVAPPNQNYTLYFIQPATGSNPWAHATTDPAEQTTLGNLGGYNIQTTVQYLDIDAGTTFDDGRASYDCIRCVVRVEYRLNTGEFVELETVMAP